jgi:hypothetical protein
MTYELHLLQLPAPLTHAGPLLLPFAVLYHCCLQRFLLLKQPALLTQRQRRLPTATASAPATCVAQSL